MKTPLELAIEDSDKNYERLLVACGEKTVFYATAHDFQSLRDDLSCVDQNDSLADAEAWLEKCRLQAEKDEDDPDYFAQCKIYRITVVEMPREPRKKDLTKPEL